VAAKKIRVFELARELGMTNKEVLKLSENLGVGVKSHSSGMIEAQADRVRRKAEREGLTRDEQPEEHRTARPASETRPLAEEKPITARNLRVVRSEQVDAEALAGLSRSIEPLFGLAEQLLGSADMPDEQAARVEHLRRGLRQEMFENPGDPSPAVLTAYSTKLISLLAEWLPEVITEGRTEPNQADRSARGLIVHVTVLGSSDPESAGETAADIADDLGDVAAEIEAPEGVVNNASRSKGRSSVLEHLGWGSVAAAGGASGGSGLVPIIAQSVSPMWGAVLGAVAGVLAYLFKVGVDR
jgi:hypothetical protein